MTGETLPPALSELRGALAAGATGLDGTLAISGPLLEAQRAADPFDFAAADREICATAIRGAGDNVPMTADELRVMATVWATAMDQDGAEPLEQAAMRKRAVSIGAVRDGLVPISGRLLPGVAAQLQWIADATGNPRVKGVRFVEADECLDDEALVERDPRTAAQKMHDALATAVTVAAASENLTTIGGAAPTLVVHVDEAELLLDRGWARVGATPVALSVARHVGCSGVIQRVSTAGADGRITAIGTEERVFNRHQRRAIALRDGGCVIPGCTVAAAWCEVHHVTEHAQGGKTHTDNRVLLCWNHHRFLEHRGWSIRINAGTPEVKAPHWMDPHGRWRKPHPPRPMTRANRRT